MTSNDLKKTSKEPSLNIGTVRPNTPKKNKLKVGSSSEKLEIDDTFFDEIMKTDNSNRLTEISNTSDF